MSAIFKWANSNQATFDAYLDAAVRDNANTEELKTAVAEVISETGLKTSGCSAIDAIARKVSDRIRQHLEFFGDDETEAVDAADAERERKKTAADRDEAEWENAHEALQEDLRTRREFESAIRH